MKRSLALLLLISLTLMGSAQKSLPSNFFLRTLDNGLDVLVIEDRSVPLATLELCVKNGGYTESPEYDGLSHLYEHMFFKANRDYPNQEAFMEKIREMGAIFNGTTSEERVNYFITVTNTNLEEGLKFLNTAMRYPKFDQEEMTKENPVVDGEFQRAESNPTWFLFNDVQRALWTDQYSRKNVIGDHDIINTATPEKMRIIKEKFYHPNNTILAIAGDVDHEKTFKMVYEIYGDWKRSEFEPFEKYPVPEFKPLESSTRLVTENEYAQVPMVMMSFHGPDTRSDLKATYAADVFSYILSQNSSKFSQDMIESGLTQGINVGYQTLKHVGPISIFMVLKNPEQLNQAIEKLFEHIDQWDSDDYYTDEQMQVAKDLLAISEAYSRERSSSFIHTVTYWWASASIDYYVNYLDNLQKVTRQDIKDYVRKYIKGQPYVAGMLVSPMMRKMFDTDASFTDTRHIDSWKMNFAENSASLDDEAVMQLNGLAQWLAINPGKKFELKVNAGESEAKKVKVLPEDISSHPDKANLPKKASLEEARSYSISSVLTDLGVDADRVSISTGRAAVGHTVFNEVN